MYRLQETDDVDADITLRQILAHQAATRHTVAHIAAKFPVRRTAVRVRSTRPLAQRVDRGQVDAVGVPQMLAQFRLLPTAQMTLANGHVEVRCSQSAFALDDVLAVEWELPVDARGDGGLCC